MDSKSRRFPFAVSSSSSLSSSSSSSALSASRLYGRGSVLGRDRFSREASVKLDSDYQSSRLLSFPRGYNSTESRHSNWKLSTPVSLSSSSSSSSSSSCDRTWTESTSGDRGRLTDSERRLGTYCGLLGTSQDSESKRAKLSYTNRAAYSRSPSTSKPASSYSTLGNSSWKSSISPLSRSSSSSSSSSSSTPSEGLWARRDLEKRGDSGLTSLGESSYRPSGLTSSLYRSERVTSTYAQGARPKESQYSSHRENGSSSRHISAEYLPSPLERSSYRLTSDYQSGPFSRDTPRSSSSSTRTSASVSDPSKLSSWSSTPYTPLTGCSSSPPSSSPSPTPLPAQNGGDSDGRRTTRRLLSRLFSRRSSQESNSTASSASDSRSYDSSPDEAPPSESSPPVSRENLEAELRNLSRRGPSLAPVQESSGVVEPQPESLRSPAGLSWLNWNRCTPLFSRRRREGRDESARMDPRRSPQFPFGDRDCCKTPDRGTDCDDDDDDDDDDEDESSEGATAAPSAGASGLSASLLQDGARLAGRSHGMGRLMTNPLFRMPENMIIGVGVGAEGRSQTDEQVKDKPAPSRDPERLRQIQESLLLEDSDEEEGDLCRICQMGEQSSSNPLIEPCKCTGSLQFVHQDCIKKWLRSKISSGSNLEAITTCELCKEKLHLNIENFDINELYRSHERSEYEFISCGLYLVVLLHLCEQRFSDVLGAVNDAGVHTQNRMKMRQRTADRPSISVSWRMMMMMMRRRRRRRRRRFNVLAGRKEAWLSSLSRPPPTCCS
ncbi:E3 ubiquitin-protein ligase MARCH7-like isoform X2 [Sinocyclocheilus rhinocerous]|uniref:RING-type E3 ubiquitin transferase n=1 Tax=Sinocyclocheilus rhinocerous TaxID=307959 RepID=A0A673G6S6_9TELE|nr:PREDICTED: E3 ubiquitin-protein ligase MARCH7-like isoform X2 [Sinocyclocheilus rhinocerous]